MAAVTGYEQTETYNPEYTVAPADATSGEPSPGLYPSLPSRRVCVVPERPRVANERARERRSGKRNAREENRKALPVLEVLVEPDGVRVEVRERAFRHLRLDLARFPRAQRRVHFPHSLVEQRHDLRRG